ncbi:hypothetical protein SAY87_011883 [Trapa incisa]|uniref:C2H2-type domain-containing protein n=1 Tax=Trapa incisa TaxID=236973 RepID=A0AAN7GGN2_9MYRT|nr:hypothetical protein SAY87_011883 [Trapa incisa]
MAESDENPGVSDPWREEKDHHHGIDEDTTSKETESSSKRSYGCIYCKRGFTNAQALGGHMNIHRKDRVSQPLPTSSSSTRQIPAPVASATHSTTPFPVDLEKYVSYRPCGVTLWSERSHSSAPCHSPAGPTNYLAGSYLQVAISSASSSMSGEHHEALGLDLSLKVGSSYNGENKGDKTDQTKEEIDLELRLGRCP